MKVAWHQEVEVMSASYLLTQSYLALLCKPSGHGYITTGNYFVDEDYNHSSAWVICATTVITS
jgi:hypothetical protein